MIIGTITSVIDNIKQKIKNPTNTNNKTPFAGAFIISFVIYNWELFFTVFNFDSTDLLATKIQTIKRLIKLNSWFDEIFYPTLYAFISILFYYTFNIISLGITTFFNRWFTSLILSISDKSKLVSRIDFENEQNKLNRLSLKYEDLLKTSAESRVEQDLIKSKNQEIELEILTKTRENEHLELEHKEAQDRIKNLDNLLNSFRVIYANYGKDHNKIDVTEKLKDYFSKTLSLVITNANLTEKDPYPNQVKELFLVYEYMREVHLLNANEYEIIEFKDGKIKSYQTEESMQMSLQQNRIKLSKIFNKNIWQLTYDSKNKGGGKEIITVDESGVYYIDKIKHFKLVDIHIEENKIKFSKQKLNGAVHSKEELDIIDANQIEGTDNLGFNLRYQKIDA